MPDWLQLPTEGFIEQSPATESAGGDSTWAKEPGTFLFIFSRKKASQRASAMSLLNFLKIPIAKLAEWPTPRVPDVRIDLRCAVPKSLEKL